MLLGLVQQGRVPTWLGVKEVVAAMVLKALRRQGEQGGRPDA
jgi:hypothetical protein